MSLMSIRNVGAEKLRQSRLYNARTGHVFHLQKGSPIVSAKCLPFVLNNNRQPIESYALPSI